MEGDEGFSPSLTFSSFALQALHNMALPYTGATVANACAYRGLCIC